MLWQSNWIFFVVKRSVFKPSRVRTHRGDRFPVGRSLSRPLAEDVEAECQSSAKVFRYQKVLQATSFHLLAAAVGKSPSVLGTIDGAKAEKVARLSGAAGPVHDPKVPQSIQMRSVLFSRDGRKDGLNLLCRKWRRGCS